MKKILTFALVLLTLIAEAQDVDSADIVDIDEIARRMSNPTLPMMNITSFIEYQGYTGTLPGANDQSLTMIALQPPLPIPFKSGKNLIIRPLIPLMIGQPVYGTNGFESTGFNLGNISVDVLYGGTNAKGILSGFGMIASLPTATNKDIRGEWALGPSAMIGVMRKWGVFLVLLTQSWDISGEVKQARLGGQYAMAFSLPKGWQLVSSPPFTYNWDTKDFTFPLGGGPFRTVMLGKTPTKLGLQAYYFVSQPDAFGQKWSLRLQIQPSVKRPW